MASLQPNKRSVVLSLVEPRMYKRFCNAIADAVIISFMHCPGRQTAQAVKERGAIAYDIFLILRADMSYPMARIEEVLGHYVAMDMEGVEWNPLKRRTWIPGDPVGFQNYGMTNPDPDRGVREFYTDGLPNRRPV